MSKPKMRLMRGAALSAAALGGTLASSAHAVDAPSQPRFEIEAVTAAGADVRARWSGSATSYSYRSGANSGAEWSASDLVLESEVLLRNVPLDGSHWFCVHARDNAGLQSAARCNSFTTPAHERISSPGRPQFAQAAGPDAGSQVTASWGMPSSGHAVSYRYRAGDQRGAVWSAQGEVTENSVVLENLPAGEQYWFCISALDAQGEISGDACNSFTTAAGGSSDQAGVPIDECANPRPEWIWCDDFEQDRTSAYFEASMPRRTGIGVDGSTGVVGRYVLGSSEAGNLKLAFGRTPHSRFRAVDDGTRNYREIYWRHYVKHPANWQGGGADKLSRATVFTGSNWQQAMIAHVWSGTDRTQHMNFLKIDPASGTHANGGVRTTRYNDFANLRWLGARHSAEPVFGPGHNGEWQCVEARVRLNDAGRSNGVFQLWINDELSVERHDLNWVGTYTGYGINSVFLENYWNNRSPVEQERYMDNFVVSTERIGC